MSSSFTERLARRLDASPEAAAAALRTLAEEVHAEVAHEGRFSLEGLGAFAQEDGVLTFEPETRLAHLVNRHYEGLEPLPLASAPEQTPPAGASEPQEEAPATESPPPPIAPEGPLPAEMTEPADDDAAWVPAWASADVPDDHPLGPLPEAPYEDADYAVMDDEDDAPGASMDDEDETREASRHVALPPETLRTPFAPVQGGLFAANLRLQAEALKGARVASPEPQAPQPAPDRVPEQREPHRRTHASAALSWVGGLLVLLLLAGASWYFFGGRGGLPSLPFASEPPVSDSDAPRAVSSAVPIAPSADSGAAAGAARPDTASSTPTTADTSRAPAADPLGFASAAGEWALVVASRTDRAGAERLVQVYREHFAGTDLAVELLAGETDGVRRYRVALGPFPSLDATNAANERYGERLPSGAWPLRLPE